MIVVSDTTPIISLLKANCLELLKNLYGQVLIPESVYRELTENSAYVKEAEIVRAADFLQVAAIENKKSMHVLMCVSGLDAGESEALIMYDERKADLLLMDEHKGRIVAKKRNVRFIGTAGLLMLAYDKGVLKPEGVKECLKIMLDSGIRLDKKICNTVLKYIGLEAMY